MDFTHIVIIVSIVIALMLFYIWLKLRTHAFSSAVQKKIQKSWTHIKELSDKQQAVLEADKLLDFVLQQKGYQGTLGEKLKASKTLFSHLNEVWFAHKLRNVVAHELHYQVSHKEYERAMIGFYRALRDLGCQL